MRFLTKRPRLKDSDVTWLYGPLHTAAEPVPPARVATTEDRLDLVKAIGKKPILKHRSISELLSIPRGSSPSLEASHLDAIPESPRPVLHQTRSESYITRTRVRRVSPPLPDLAHVDPITGEETAESPKPPSDTDSMASNNTKRHISFNTFVEQCIAIEKPPHVAYYNHPPWRLGFGGPSYSGSGDDENDAIYEDDEDAVLTMRSTSSSGQSSAASSRRPSSSTNSRSNSHSSERVTIQAIAPTMLKTQYEESAPGDLPAVVYVPPLGSPYAEDPAITPAHFAHQSPSGFGGSQATLHLGSHSSRNPAATRSQWEDGSEDCGAGFDFFGGPDVGMEQEYESTKGITRVVSTSQVGPAQPHAGVSGLVRPTIATYIPPPRSPPSSPSKSNKVPGKSILKSSFPDAAIAEALRESADNPDRYFSKTNLITPPTFCGVPAPNASEPVDGGSAPTASLDTITVSSPISSEHLNPSTVAPVRGRSAVRIIGAAIGIADRERSASSKGSSPIGSVSPNSRSTPVGSSGRTSVVTIRAPRKGREHLAASPPSPLNTRSPSRGTVSSTSSERSPSPRSNGPLGDRGEGAGSRGSFQGEETFQPNKSAPVQSPAPKKRLSLDIVPVLPAQGQPAPAQHSPSDASWSLSNATTTTGEHPAERSARRGEIEAICVKPPRPDVTGSNGADSCASRSTSLTLNSPTNNTFPLPPASPPSTTSPPLSKTSENVISENASSIRLHRDAPNAKIHFENPLPDGFNDELDARDEGTLVSRAVDIVTSARGLFGAIWNAGAGQTSTSASTEPYSAVNGRHPSDH